jgi:serine/threonine-protein kinase HipA
MKDSLEVNVNGKKVGNLVFENNEYIYSYTGDEKHDYISLTMPVRVKSYINRQLHPIFEMHLPEGYLLSVIKKHFSKLTKTDDFGLLKLMSQNIKGRVNYKNQKSLDREVLTLDSLIHPSTSTLFDELVNKFALTSALSGVQPKVLAKVQDKATLAFQDYIVKSWGEDYPNLALNEYYCMQIIKKANIEVPEFYLSDDHKLFIMKRFDLKEDGTFLGFEDMCVLQAKQRDDKYDGSYEGIVKTIKTFTSAKHKKNALSQFFKMIVINNFVQNGDGHLKNYGLLYEDIHNIKLAPSYDVVSTTMYIKNDIPALHLLGSKKWWTRKFLIRFALESCDLSLKESNALYDECLVALQCVIDEIKIKIEVENSEDIKVFLGKLIEIFEVYLESSEK